MGYFLGATPLNLVIIVATCVTTELRPEWSNREISYPKLAWWTGLALFMCWGWGLVYDPVLAHLALICLSISTLPYLRFRWPLILLLVVVNYAILGSFLSLTAPGMLAAMELTLWTIRINVQLAAKKEAEAALKIAEERLRFANELHDTLGQQLASISMGAELASAFAAKKDPRLIAQLEQLRNTAKQSMRDMRAVAHGYRDIALDREVTNATELLTSYGIRVNVIGSPWNVPAHHRELAAWVVREATTNIVKHADATWALIELSASTVRVLNDTAYSTPRPLGGLASLQRRAQAGKMVLTVTPGEEFEVELSW
ncbi:histidine kinase [Staphylococcus chromogenes]|nr:histidine kinase [Staphylococcus chromogenes]